MTEQPDVRERLIRGTFEVLAADGTDGLTVRRIAEAAGRSTMCVYSKFGNRRRLLQEVYHRAADELAQALGSRPRAPLDLALGYRRFARRHPERYALLFEHALGPLELPPSARQDAVRQVVDALAANGVDPARGHAAWAAMHGLLVLERSWPGTRRVPWAATGWEDWYSGELSALLA